ncbi:MAG: oligosaccharide flippase family protein [Anaerolineales bacterium]|nr:oligosaccharide flippase family protein [Anaerolineales bacterium]
MQQKLAPLELLRSLLEKGFLYLLSANFLAQFLSFLTSLVVTKFLDPARLADVKVLQSYVIFFLVFAGYGFSSAALKYCAEDRPAEDKAYLLRQSLLSALVFTAITLAVVALMALAGLVTRPGYLTQWLIIYLSAVPFIVMYDILIAYLQAGKRIKEMSRMQAIYKTITFFAVILGTWRWGLEGFVVGTIAASLIGLLPLFKTVRLDFLKARKGSMPAGYNRMVLFSMLAYSITILGQYGDIFILDHFVIDRQSIGHYSLATYFVLAGTQATMTIQAILIPYFSQHGRQRAWFDRNLRQYQLLTSGLSLLIALGIQAAAWLLIRFVYGPAYQPSQAYLFVLSLRYLLFSSYAILSAALTGIEMVRYHFFAVGVAVPSGLFLSYLLQEPYGAMGVAWAQVIAAGLTLALEVFWVQRARKMLELPPE